MKHIKIGILLTILGPLLLLSGCIVKDSPAPGCIEYIGFAPVGGCNGKTIITDMVLEGFPECVQVRVNNCNGGVLEVNNSCSQSLLLDGIEIPAGASYSVDIQPTNDGKFELVPVPSNFSEFIGLTDQNIEITDSVGDQNLLLTFIKTAPLCE
jgi:hypothetical protein